MPWRLGRAARKPNYAHSSTLALGTVVEVTWSESYVLAVPRHTRNATLRAADRLARDDSAAALARNFPSDGQLEPFDLRVVAVNVDDDDDDDAADDDVDAVVVATAAAGGDEETGGEGGRRGTNAHSDRTDTGRLRRRQRRASAAARRSGLGGASAVGAHCLAGRVGDAAGRFEPGQFVLGVIAAHDADSDTCVVFSARAVLLQGRRCTHATAIAHGM